MEKITDNMQKYENYKTQMGRLKRAIGSKFYLEAIFIEYAIIEDRFESVLRHSGNFNPKPGEHWSIERKINKVSKMAEQKKSLAKKYFSEELITEVKAWKENRNTMIHALLKQSLHTEDLEEFALDGQEIVKILCNKTSLFNRAIEKQKAEG